MDSKAEERAERLVRLEAGGRQEGGREPGELTSSRPPLHPPQSPLAPHPPVGPSDLSMSIPLPSPMLSLTDATKELVQLGETSQAKGVKADVKGWVAELDDHVSMPPSLPRARSSAGWLCSDRELEGLRTERVRLGRKRGDGAGEPGVVDLAASLGWLCTALLVRRAATPAIQ